MMNKYVIVVAGGKGLRMGSDIPKQFLKVAGRPVLMHTLQVFRNYSEQVRILLVLPSGEQDYWNRLCRQYRFDISHRIITGGETRFHSVRNGLEAVEDGALVGVHDGVRPLVAESVIRDAFDKAENCPAVIPVVRPADSLRQIVSGEKSVSADRSLFRLVQTPQVFQSSLLKKAYRQEYREFFTDDASVMEASGYEIVLIPGNPENIKLTTPGDLEIAEWLLKKCRN